MALEHATPLTAIDLLASSEEWGTALSTSFLKTAQLQLLRIVLSAGDRLPQHQVPNEITIQCLMGEVYVTTPQSTATLTHGCLMALPAGEPHAVSADRDAVLLVTIVKGAKHDESAA